MASEILHIPIGMRRPGIKMAHSIIVPATDLLTPITIGLVMAEVPTVGDVERLVGRRHLIQCEPWLDPDFSISRIVVITKIVVTVGWPADEVLGYNVNVNGIGLRSLPP